MFVSSVCIRKKELASIHFSLNWHEQVTLFYYNNKKKTLCIAQFNKKKCLSNTIGMNTMFSEIKSML